MPINTNAITTSDTASVNTSVQTEEKSIKPAKQNSVVFEISDPIFSLNDVILPKHTIDEVLDFISYKNQQDYVFQNWGLSNTHKQFKQSSINLYGEPGTGKTMAAHAIASELGLPMIMVNYADIESKYVGETSKNITQLFKQAQEKKAIIFFDEADAILSKRVTNMSHATDVSVNQTRSVLLTLMNQYDGVIIFATNFVENYDAAFMRRIVSHIKFDLPDLQSRQKLWDLYIPSQLPRTITTEKLAEISEGMSGSDIANAVLKAAMSAARAQKTSVEDSFFENAVKSILDSKKANKGSQNKAEKVSERKVDESEVRSQLGDAKVNEIKQNSELN